MRVLLRLLSALIGLAAAVAGALLAIEAAWALIRPGAGPLLVPWPTWRDRLADLSWSQTPVLLVGGALVVTGLLLLVLAISAGRRYLPMAEPAGEITVVTSPRSLARLIGHWVRGQDGVRSASVTASARRVRVRAVSTPWSAEQLRAALPPRLTDLVGGLPLARQPRVRVTVRSPKGRR